MSIKVGPSVKDFPVVCVGGSAGGLDAYIRLLQNLPADMGVAIVIVNHVTNMPTHLHEILPRFDEQTFRDEINRHSCEARKNLMEVGRHACDVIHDDNSHTHVSRKILQ